MKWWPFQNTNDSKQLERTLLSFVNARTRDQAQRIVEQHPELLRKDTQALLEQLEDAQEHAETIKLLRQRRKMLDRCREVGIAAAFASMPPSPERATGSSNFGLGRQEYPSFVSSSGQMPPELREALETLATEGCEIRTPEDLGRQLAARPQLIRKLMQIQADGDTKAMAGEFFDDFREAQESEKRFQQTGDLEALEVAAAAWSRILEAKAFSSAQQRFRLSVLNNAGCLFRSRYQVSGRIEDLKHAIDLLQQAVRGAPQDHSKRPGYLSNLGLGLLDRFGRLGSEFDLEEAVQVFQLAVEATSPESPDRPMFLGNLGNGFLARFRLRGQDQDLESAIRVYREVIDATPADSPSRPRRFHHLGDALRDRFAQRGQEADIEEAIQQLREAVQGTPANSPERPERLESLAGALRDRFERTGNQQDIEEAIRVWRLAVETMPPESPNLPNCLSHLGAGLNERYARTGREADLEEAIQVCQLAVRTTPTKSADLPGHLTNLGSVLRARFARTGQETDLEEAIKIWQLAVETTAPDSQKLVERLNNLGIGLRDLFSRTRRMSDLEGAITAWRLALQTTQPDSPSRPTILSSLGIGLLERSSSTRSEPDLQEAIRLFRQAVEATRPDSPQMPMYLGNLGNGLRARFGRTGREADLEEAIRVYQQAVEATTPDSPQMPGYLNNLGAGLSARFARTGREVDLEEGIRVFRRASDVGRLTEPKAALTAACNWGRWAAQRENWTETLESYSKGLETGRQLLTRQLLREHKEGWLRDLQEMSSGAAYALAKLYRCEEAAIRVERGRARLFAEALQRRRRDLEELPARGHADLYHRYREIANKQEKLTQPDDQQGLATLLRGQARLDAVIATAGEFERVIAEIRQVPGYGDFLAEPDFTAIRSAAHDTPLAYVLATSVGGLALVAYAGVVQPIWLDSLTDAAVREWLRGPANDQALGGWLGAYMNWLGKSTPQAQQAWLAAIDDITHRLWTHLMQPLAEALHQMRLPGDSSVASRVTLIPAGLLALLPLHAAWTEDAATATGRRYFLDEFTVHYAPSALALAHARYRADHASPDHLLAVEEPLTSSASPLPNVHGEVTAIAGLFDAPVILAGRKATRQAVLSALPDADVVHFSCHGSNNWQSPLDSGLLMADDETGKDVLLNVRDLLESRQAGGRLATLSACETGIVGTELPDEVVALPSALLQAGYAGVAASLWSVSDISTAMLMEHFYHGWREAHKERLTPAEALRAAQRWLRDTTNKEKAEYFKRYNPEPPAQHMPEAAAVDFFTYAMSRDQDGRDFAHPFWWAAFYLTGV